MKMFGFSRATESSRVLDREIEDFSTKSKRFRCVSRPGTIVVVDRDRDTYDLICQIAKSHECQVEVVHVSDPSDAQAVIERLSQVKAVIVSLEAINEQRGGMNGMTVN